MKRALAVLLAALLTSGPAWAGPTYTVCSTGSPDYATTAACWAAAVDAAGTYCQHCAQTWSGVSIDSTKTWTYITADTNAVATDHSVTPSHPVFDGNGAAYLIKFNNGFWMVGAEVTDYSGAPIQPTSSTKYIWAIEHSYIHDVGGSCIVTDGEYSGVADGINNVILENCGSRGHDHTAVAAVNSMKWRRVTVIDPVGSGITCAGCASSQIATNILVTGATGSGTWGVDLGIAGGICDHCTVIGGDSGVRGSTIRYSIAGSNALHGLCSGVGPTSQSVAYSNTNNWGTAGASCNTTPSSSSTTAPTYVDTVDYVPCTGSSPDGLSGSSTTTIDLGNNARTNPEDAGAWEAVSCGPPPGTRAKLVDDGVRLKLVDDGVRAKLVD